MAELQLAGPRTFGTRRRLGGCGGRGLAFWPGRVETVGAPGRARVPLPLAVPILAAKKDLHGVKDASQQRNLPLRVSLAKQTQDGFLVHHEAPLRESGGSGGLGSLLDRPCRRRQGYRRSPCAMILRKSPSTQALETAGR